MELKLSETEVSSVTSLISLAGVKGMDVYAVLRVNVSIRRHFSQDCCHCHLACPSRESSPFTGQRLTSLYVEDFKETVNPPGVTDVCQQ